MRAIVTRPAAQAGGWVRALQALRVDAVALPLISIGPPPDPAPLHAAWQRLRQFGPESLVMFVSANAVEAFFSARPAPERGGGTVPGRIEGTAPARIEGEGTVPACIDGEGRVPACIDGEGTVPVPWPTGVRAGATGPGTVAALRAAGVPAAAIVAPGADAAQFDSEALWALLAPEPWQGRAVLVVRGEQGRDWLADTLAARGAQVDFVAAYRRSLPDWSVTERQVLHDALARPGEHVWLFSSSEAVANLGALAPAASWAPSRALASHPRIETAARAAGFGQVALCPPRPDAAAAWIASQPDASAAAAALAALAASVAVPPPIESGVP